MDGHDRHPTRRNVTASESLGFVTGREVSLRGRRQKARWFTRASKGRQALDGRVRRTAEEDGIEESLDTGRIDHAVGGRRVGAVSEHLEQVAEIDDEAAPDRLGMNPTSRRLIEDLQATLAILEQERSDPKSECAPASAPSAG